MNHCCAIARHGEAPSNYCPTSFMRSNNAHPSPPSFFLLFHNQVSCLITVCLSSIQNMTTYEFNWHLELAFFYHQLEDFFEVSFVAQVSFFSGSHMRFSRSSTCSPHPGLCLPLFPQLQPSSCQQECLRPQSIWNKPTECQGSHCDVTA